MWLNGTLSPRSLHEDPSRQYYNFLSVKITLSTVRNLKCITNNHHNQFWTAPRQNDHMNVLNHYYPNTPSMISDF